jgi:transcriptional regulator of acetoin/glycerol metabolism
MLLFMPTKYPRATRDATDRGAENRPRHDTDNAEHLQLLEALQRAGWNRRHAAKLLRISYASLLVKLRKHGFNPESGQPS